MTVHRLTGPDVEPVPSGYPQRRLDTVHLVSWHCHTVYQLISQLKVKILVENKMVDDESKIVGRDQPR